MDKLWDKYRRNSKGWLNDPIARAHIRIYIGCAEDVDIYAFEQLNITHVVNCAEDHATSPWFKHLFPERIACIGALDRPDENIIKWYPTFEKVMNTFLANPNCRSIYVHCECGINRSAFLTLIYMCVKFGYEPETMIKNIAIQRPCVFTNTAYRIQAIEYIKKHH